ncbi:hypothetical protein DFH08DRAFT_1079039 [Mycena albidolilacea]|uniref:Uncharacterized protein n=1 Tax=Mycena albidolilacea TaxID=1033008 RepID=A0AAD7ESG6_9AGAR|nr:hypothetical protein DFH08DRAFT_1079039 [Mycena albidolilacea]
MLKVWRIFSFIRRPFAYPPTLTFIVSIESGGKIIIMVGTLSRFCVRSPRIGPLADRALEHVSALAADILVRTGLVEWRPCNVSGSATLVGMSAHAENLSSAMHSFHPFILLPVHISQSSPPSALVRSYNRCANHVNDFSLPTRWRSDLRAALTSRARLLVRRGTGLHPDPGRGRWRACAVLEASLESGGSGRGVVRCDGDVDAWCWSGGWHTAAESGGRGARDSPIPNLSLWLSQRSAGPPFLPCPRSFFCTTATTFRTPTRAGTRSASTAPLPSTRSRRLPHLGLGLRRSVIPRSRCHSHYIAYLPPIICKTYVARADYDVSPRPLSLPLPPSLFRTRTRACDSEPSPAFSRFLALLSCLYHAPVLALGMRSARLGVHHTCGVEWGGRNDLERQRASEGGRARAPHPLHPPLQLELRAPSSSCGRLTSRPALSHPISLTDGWRAQRLGNPVRFAVCLRRAAVYLRKEACPRSPFGSCARRRPRTHTWTDLQYAYAGASADSDADASCPGGCLPSRRMSCRGGRYRSARCLRTAVRVQSCGERTRWSEVGGHGPRVGEDLVPRGGARPCILPVHVRAFGPTRLRPPTTTADLLLRPVAVHPLAACPYLLARTSVRAYFRGSDYTRVREYCSALPMRPGAVRHGRRGNNFISPMAEEEEGRTEKREEPVALSASIVA